MSVRCPKCGSGNVIGYMGEWECNDCGYKFRVEGFRVRAYDRQMSITRSNRDFVKTFSKIGLMMFIIGIVSLVSYFITIMIIPFPQNMPIAGPLGIIGVFGILLGLLILLVSALYRVARR